MSADGAPSAGSGDDATSATTNDTPPESGRPQAGADRQTPPPEVAGPEGPPPGAPPAAPTRRAVPALAGRAGERGPAPQSAAVPTPAVPAPSWATGAAAAPAGTPIPAPAAARPPLAADAPAAIGAEGHNLPAFTHEYLRAYIALADQKAAGIFALASALLAYVKAEGGLDLTPWRSGTGGVRDAAGLAAAGLLASAAWFAAHAALPRLSTGAVRYALRRRGGVGAAPATVPARDLGVLYWDDILAHDSPTAYAVRVEAMTPAEARGQVLRHNWTLAGINRSKYGDVSRASVLGAFAFAATVAFTVLDKPRRAIPPPPVTAALRAARPSTPPPAAQGMDGAPGTARGGPRAERVSAPGAPAPATRDSAVPAPAIPFGTPHPSTSAPRHP